MKSILYKLLPAVLSFLVLSAKAQTDVLHLKSDVVDTFFGKAVADPYRWMENLGSDSVKQWLQEQKKITKVEKNRFEGRMATASADMEANAYIHYTSDEKTGPWYFQMMTSSDPLNPSSILYIRENTTDRFETAFNPNDIGGRTTYNIEQWELSDSGGFLAVSLSPAGSDWREIRVRNLYKQKDLKDKINWVKFSNVVWWHDGFFYARYKSNGQTTALGGKQLYYHKLGNSQDDDKLLMLTSNSDISFQKTSNGRYLVVNKNQKIGNNWYNVVVYKDLNAGLDDDWKFIVQSPAKENAYFKVIDYADSGFIVQTNYKAPYSRVLRAMPDNVNHLVEIIPEYDRVLKNVSYIYHQLVAIYFTKGAYEVCTFASDGKMLHRLKFDPGIEVAGFKGTPNDSETTFYEKMFYLPTMVERYNFKTQEHEPVHKTHITFNGENYTTSVVNYTSKDGTEVSMYLTYKKGLKLKGNNPVILYGYGGFGIPATPFYDYSNIIFFNNGGILAVPMIRGGGELGDDWHEGGKRLNKQNSFDDFVAAAEYLKKEGYTSTEKLAIEGASNGGLLVGATITQHPEICKVAVAQAGVYDMLRYPKFTGGKYWLGEYGSPDNPIDFENLLSYSPLHNVKPGVAYPSTLFITGRNDDRVVPFHTYKFLARLQECSAGNNPHILYFEEDAGHNGATGYQERNEQEAFILAFIFTEMNLPLKYF